MAFIFSVKLSSVVTVQKVERKDKRKGNRNARSNDQLK